MAVFKNVTLEQGEDGLWYLNITFAEGVDTSGFIITLTKGDASYLAANLGVSGIKLNGTVMLLTAPAADEENAPTAGTEQAGEKDSDKTPATGTETAPATGTEQAVGARVCWCGEKIDIANQGGLSAEEKAAWKAHAAAHMAKGERTNYTDVAY